MRVRIHNSEFLILNSLLLVAAAASAQSPPEGPGKIEFESVCSLCHDGAAAVMGKQWTRPQWEAKVSEMLQEEVDVTSAERAAIVTYLSANFRPGGKIYINKASAKDLAVSLDVAAGDAEAIVRYRDLHGSFKTLDEVKQVAGVDGRKLDARKDRFAF